MLTHPLRDTGALLDRVMANVATARSATTTTAMTRCWPRVSGCASRCEWPTITMRAEV
jgi:hypothetical protein